MNFSLAILEGPGAGQTLEFDQPEVSFGRVDDNDVVLYDPDVSRKHFCIVLEGDRHILNDLGSSNGTRVNGELVESCELADGDTVQVGQAVFEYQAEAIEAGAAAAAPPAIDQDAGGGSARERFKAREAASTRWGRTKLWYSGLAPARRLLLHVAGGVAALMLGLLIVVLVRGDDGLMGVPDHSGSIAHYERRMSQWRFGYGVEGLTHQARDDLGFSFHYLDGRVTLTFDAGFIEGETDVEIRLNDVRLVGYAPLSIGTWIRDNQIVLPADALHQQGMNEIVFDQSRNPGSSPSSTWAIENVRIVEDALPQADPFRAEERYQLAERRWRNREISPRNLYHACEHYREARDFLERLDVKPARYDEIVERIRVCSQKLDHHYRRLIFEAQRHETFRDMDAARATLYQILEYFPDETHPRHRTVQEMLRAIN